MDVFCRTFLPAAAQTGVASPTVSRHLPILRNCVDAGDPTVLVTRCIRPERSTHHSYLLLVTTRRLVVTEQTRVLHRLRLHLNADLRHLGNVTWTPDPRELLLELAATAVDGVRERFLIRADRPSQVWELDALFSHVFRPKMTARAGFPPRAVAVPGAGTPADATAVQGSRAAVSPVVRPAGVAPAGVSRTPRLRPVLAV
ncbi:hypothetical protein I0C86_22510 [Plantactinospora sp. S1510]|uniref:Uncharacterized protein n=1 Tax=Plantactinospora alkalitolerans TaxID=2789879 RepID=A0ABS0GZS6_9ACTN|nr:hypothetical protein [Plantactinospora alkalitolerans]